MMLRTSDSTGTLTEKNIVYCIIIGIFKIMEAAMYNKVKIGPRILSNHALKKLLPSSITIENEIEVMRSNAKISTEAMKKNRSRETLNISLKRDCNNIFSILGVRGSGKTSVLLTLRKRIDKKEDIILPLIVPEKMGEVTDVLGCILGLFGSVVEKLDSEFYRSIENKEEKIEKFSNYFKNCRRNSNNPLQEKYNELLKQYLYTKPDYRKLLLDQYNGFSDYVTNASNILDSDQKLLGKFENFIEELLKIKREINNNDQEPLIYLFFDDVDLSYDRCSEVLAVILRYLSNDNIVVFLAGDEETFLEVLTIDSLRKDGLLNEEKNTRFYRDKTALDCRKDLSKELLKKVMPPAFRYYMPCMNEQARAEFVVSIEDIDDAKEMKYPTLHELIEEIYIKNSGNPESDFLRYDEKLLYQYFKIFDQTPRGAINVYYFLYSKKNDKENFVLGLKRFVETLVQSSTALSKYNNHISNIIDIREDEESYINYQYIIEHIEGNEFDSDEDKLIIFMLAHFIENIIAIKTDRNRKVHGAEVLGEIINSLNTQFRIYPKINDVNLLLYMHQLISVKISRQNIKKIEENDYYLKKYFEILHGVIKIQSMSTYEFFWKIYREDKRWVDQIITKIMKYSAGPATTLKEHADIVYKNLKSMNMNDKVVSEIGMELKGLVQGIPEDIATGRKRYGKMRDFLLKEFLMPDEPENIIAEYEDDILYMSATLEKVEVRYRVTEEYKSKIENLLKSEAVSKRLVVDIGPKLASDIINLGERSSVSEEMYNELLWRIDRIIFKLGNRRTLVTLKKGIESFPRELPDDLWSERNSTNESVFTRLKEESIKYVAAKTYVDMEEKLVANADGFSTTVEKLKDALLEDSQNAIGFRKYLVRKDEESRMVTLDV